MCSTPDMVNFIQRSHGDLFHAKFGKIRQILEMMWPAFGNISEIVASLGQTVAFKIMSKVKI